MKKRIKIKRGSIEHKALLKMREEGMDKIGGISGVISQRFIYVVYPIEGLKLVGSLGFDFYKSLEADVENVPLFEDVFNLELIIQEVEIEQGKVDMIGQNKKHTIFRAMPHMFKLGRYLASENDVIIELDKSSGIYQVYLQMVSNIQVFDKIPNTDQ